MANIKLTVELHKSSLSTAAGKYTGVVSYNGSIDNDDIAEEISADRTDIRPETIKFVLTAADAIKCKLLKQGFVINDGVGVLRLTVNGVFTGEKASYDCEVNSLDVVFAPCSDLRDDLAEIEVETKPGTTGTTVNYVYDVLSETQDTTVTAGGPMYIYGAQLRIVGDNETNGVYFVNSDGTEYKVSAIGSNEPSALMVVVPELEAGEYTLKIITQCGTKGLANQTVNTYEYGTTLTAQ